MLTRNALTLALVAVVAVAAICGNRSRKGHLLLAQGGSIITYDVSSAQVTLVSAPVGGNGIVLRDPAASPSGKRIAYVRALQPAGANPNGEQDELWIAARDGADPHPSVQNAGVLIAHPQWLDDQTVLAIVRTPSGAGLERINAGTGERTPLVDGVSDFVLSRDRSFVVLVRSTTEGATELSIAGPNGGDERHLASAAQGSTVTATAITPDGGTVAYATVAVGSPGGAAELWSTPAAGGAPTHVASLSERAIGLTYGRDQSTLYASSSASLWEVTAASGAAKRLHDADGTTLAWAP
jgi:dipeptidyl aminopeptidase/acylaminoacyl peptidase